MNAKTAVMSLVGTLFFFCSCIDETYDLNKGVSTDVQIKDNRLALPLGGLQAMRLDSLLSVEDNDMLTLMDGIYGISMQEEIEPIEVNIDDISLSLDPIRYSTDFDFQEIEVKHIQLDGIEKELDLSTYTDISVADFNEHLPKLHAQQRLHLADGNEGTREQLKETIKIAEGYGLTDFEHPLDNHVATIQNDIDCNLSFELPKEVKSVSTIILADRQQLDAESQTGTLMQFHFDHPDVFKGLEMKMTFEAKFPDMFHLSVPNDEEHKLYSQTGTHTFKITDMPVGDDGITLSVYLDSMTNIPHRDGTIYCEEPLEYTLSYTFNGTLKASTDIDIEDLDVDIRVDTEIGCRDVVAYTNPITVDFPEQQFGFPIHLEDLEYIDKVEYIEFDASQSVIKFATDMDYGFAPFELDENSYIEMIIPEQLTLGDFSIPGVEYNPDTHTFRIKDLEALHRYDWVLPLKRIDINEEVGEDGTLNIDDCYITIRQSGEGVTFKGDTKVSFSEALKKLEGTVKFTMEPIDLHITDASIVTSKIKTDINENASFSLNEPIDKGIKYIKKVDLAQPVALDLKMNLSGLDDVDITVDLNLAITLPPFLSLTSKEDSGIEIEGNVLKIKTQYQPKNPLTLSLELDALDFSTMEGGCLAPKDSTDGNTYLQYATDIEFVGSAAVESAQMSLDLLDRELKFDTEVNISEIKIGELTGLYSTEIEPITETIPLDFGDEVRKMLGEGTSIKLSRPQIMLEMENSVNIGLLFDLIIKDNNGKSLVDEEIKINAARYEEGNIIPTSTKLLITSNENILLDGYQTILIPDISDLLTNMPDSIDITLSPRIDASEDQHINLSQPLSFSGKYAVVVPFEFEELNFAYSDTISGINADLEEMTEMFSLTELGLSMNIKNTLPIGLTLLPSALDEDGNSIGIQFEGINKKGEKIEGFEIPAGNGQALDENTEGQYTSLSIKGDMKEISRLDQIAFTVKLEGATETVGGIALRPEQGIHITKLAITVGGDIEFDLEDMGSGNEEE